MKALILNSGSGHRMGFLTQDKPKAMTDIGNGYSILSRQLEQLEQLGIPEAIITTGPFADKLIAYADRLTRKPSVVYVHNPDYAATNYITSMHLAAPHLAGDDVLLLHGDLVLEDSVLIDLMQSQASVMAVDSSLPLPEKDFKAFLRNGRVHSIGIRFFGKDCVACQPAYHWLAEDFALWLLIIAEFVEGGNTGVYAENAFNALDGILPLYPLELHGRLCHEIDNPDDLAYVSKRFLQTFDSE